MAQIASQKAAAIPLGGKARTEAEQLARRLHGELRALDQGLGEPESGPRAISRRIGVDVGLCQRVLTVARGSQDSLEVLTRLPGPTGLRTVVAGLIGHLGLEYDTHPAAAAVAAFAEFVKAQGPSHAQLSKRIRFSIVSQGRGGDPRPASRRAVRVRRVMVEGAGVLSGHLSDCSVGVTIVRPIPGRGDRIEGCNATGQVGLWSEDGRFTAVMRASYLTSAGGGVDERVKVEPIGTPIEGASGGIIEEYTTSPMPVCKVEQRKGKVRMVMDLLSCGGRADFISAHRWSSDENPRVSADPRWTQLYSMKRPSRHLVLDVYLHRDLACAAKPAVGAVWWQPGLSDDLREEWEKLLPGEVPLELLGQGLRNSESAAWPRHAGLCRKLFETVGWDPSEFVGYRIDHAYPVWGSTYWIAFDFTPKV